jgi:hypothetical protein
LSDINSIPRVESHVDRFLDRFLIEFSPARSEETQVLPVDDRHDICPKYGCCCHGNNDKVTTEEKKSRDGIRIETADIGGVQFAHPKDQGVSVGILEVEAPGEHW